jgi:hypothetical protein
MEKFAASSRRTANILSKPKKSYKGKGWIDYTDWLGSKKLKLNHSLSKRYSMFVD